MVVEDGGALDLVSGDVDEDDYEGLQEEVRALAVSCTRNEVLREVEPWNTVDCENSGEVLAPKSGLVVLRWSNEPLVREGSEVYVLKAIWPLGHRQGLGLLLAASLAIVYRVLWPAVRRLLLRSSLGDF